MDTFLSLLDQFKTPLDLLVVFIFVSIIVFIVIQAARKNRVRISWGSKDNRRLIIGRELEGISEIKDAILYLFQKGEQVWRKIDRIELIEVIRNQMNYCEQRLSDLKSAAEASFLELMREKLGEGNFLNSESYLQYRIILDVVIQDLITRFRHIFRENGLPDKNEFEFQSYLEEKVSFLFNFAKRRTDEMWLGDPHINREDLVNHHSYKFYPESKKIFEDILRNGRKISFDWGEKKNTLIKEWDTITKEAIKRTEP